MRVKVWSVFLGLLLIFTTDSAVSWDLPIKDGPEVVESLEVAEVEQPKVIVKKVKKDPLIAKDARRQRIWVDSVFNTMNFEQRLGQLFMVAAYSNKGEQHKQEIAKLISEQQLGGVIFFQGGPVRQAHLTNYYQQISKVPLFVAMDAEWGVSMRLDSVINFPKAMTLGALPDEHLVYDMGREIAQQFKELGMHINFAPVVDVNSNPNNPVIGYRAFGEEKKLVTAKSKAYMKGLQDHGVLANAKHFPGHGDTESDSHYTLPVIKHSTKRIEDIDLYPYRELIDDDLMSVMVAHLHVPSLDAEKNKATTLSKYVVTDLLQDQMNFSGLIFTDALNMNGVSKFYKPGEVDLLALLAGNDILLYSQDVPKAKQMILQAVAEGKINQEEIDQRIKKVLKAKYWAGLNEIKPIETRGLVDRLNTKTSTQLVERLYADAISVVSNKNDFLPLRHLNMLNIASVTIGDKGTIFKRRLEKYAKVAHFDLDKGAHASQQAQLSEKLKDYNTVVVGLMGITNSPSRNFGIVQSDIDFIKSLSKEKSVIVVLFGNAYAAKFLQGLPHNILVFENNDFTQGAAAEVIFGGRDAKGILPVTVAESIAIGSGGFLPSLGRFSYTYPESQGLDSETLAEIDKVMEAGMRKKAMPGGVVLVAKNGEVVFEKAYGYLDYQKTQATSTSTVYDLASITKVLATTQAVMFLADRNILDMNETLGHYLPELKQTNKGNLSLKDVMAHEAGLPAFIPYYAKTVEGGSWKSSFYNHLPSETFSIPIADAMYASPSLRDSIWNWTIKSELRKPTPNSRKYSYVYSDLTMYLMQAVVERVVNQPLDQFVEQIFYEPLGLHTLTFNPVRKMPIDLIAPTEDDITFRKRLIRGYVHDPGAAMYGGVAGHAGLFGTANDVAVMMQLMLNGGRYGDAVLLDEKTIKEFTKRQSTQSRRGWGWDKPEPEKGKGGSAGALAPKSTFGHTGFTGTCVWADPENDLIYVFLSNRVNPDAGNNILLKEGIRTEIHDIIYRSMNRQHVPVFQKSE
ncbi:glycoside hydrolase family 3 N-terminal domain-containing protein [Belliella kenyensis]|uniref:beta-N-acetylhexosaminidase n=1 Tax=Belliella kenyensis TaxID=1472724 RepID=A0ABV8EQU4_9BACT|nr:glycoside hydrolase family 3 N-terminal domain-containing protein [Belliella kenyensis]MCH7402856.1 serine hydrolase [Belliella kenyensis]MDN3602562.1 glycoside hydrolase family 3 N-terminal domain-containing protein [Belliella kenyensis]